MAKKEIIQVNLAAANPNLSPATRFGNLVFVAGQTGRHPVSGEVGKDVREHITHYAHRSDHGSNQLILPPQNIPKCVWAPLLF